MTAAERLTTPCPTCHAKAGDPCVDPRGDETTRPHKTRGPGQYERHLQEEIDRTTAREKASYGPLFQYLADEEVKPSTVAELMWKKRTEAARAFDAAGGPLGLALLRQCNRGMEWLAVRHLARELERLAGEVGRLLAEHSMSTFPLDYQRMMFGEFMTTTRRQQLDPYRVPADNPLGFRIAYRRVWEPAAPLMTREEFERRFPKVEHYTGLVDEPEPDDGGLFARVMAALNPAASDPDGRPRSRLCRPLPPAVVPRDGRGPPLPAVRPRPPVPPVRVPSDAPRRAGRVPVVRPAGEHPLLQRGADLRER